jgi:hypothetical protein
VRVRITDDLRLGEATQVTEGMLLLKQANYPRAQPLDTRRCHTIACGSHDPKSQNEYLHVSEANAVFEANFSDNGGSCSRVDQAWGGPLD